jgi:hypothetical protein
MANLTLFYSSLFFGLINLFLFVICEIYHFIPQQKECPNELRYLELLVVMIIFSSILNHGYTNPLFKWSDRIIVYIYFILSSYIAIQNEISISYSIILSSLFLYTSSKYYQKDLPHILLHALMTLNNFVYFKYLTF